MESKLFGAVVSAVSADFALRYCGSTLDALTTAMLALTGGLFIVSASENSRD